MIMVKFLGILASILLVGLVAYIIITGTAEEQYLKNYPPIIVSEVVYGDKLVIIYECGKNRYLDAFNYAISNNLKIINIMSEPSDALFLQRWKVEYER